MSKKPASPLQIAVSARLRVVQTELGLTDENMAALVGVSASRWKNWINQQNFPDEEAMVRLCLLAHITMDWIYRGDVASLPLAKAIRLTARARGLNPDETTAAILAVE